MSRAVRNNRSKSPRIDESFETEERVKSRKYTTTEVDQDLDSRSFSSQIKRTNLVIMKKNSNNTVINRKIELNLSTVIKDFEPVITPQFAGSYTERKPLIQRYDQQEDQILNYSIKITPPKDQGRDKSIGRPRVETDYQKTLDNESRNVTPQRQATKSQTDSIYNESAIKIRNQKRERVPITLFSEPIRISIQPLRSNETLLTNVLNTLSQLRQSGQKHSDCIFPANTSQIFNMPKKRKMARVSFERLGKIYAKSNYKLMRQCDAINLVPGKFTSKRVHSALQILSEQPVRIMNIFLHQQLNNQGFYYLQLCQDGVWRYIIVDDFFPVQYDGKVRLLFEHLISDNDEYQIWPALIEKAISKVYGTYEDVISRQSQGIMPIFRLLTGYPCTQYSVNQDLKSFTLIMQGSIKQRFVVVIQTLQQHSQQILQKFQSLNLSPERSYQVIKVQDNTVVLRNYEQQIFIDAEYEFEQLTFFDRLLIFKGNQGYSYQSVTLKHHFSHYSQIDIQVQKQTQGFFDVWQKNAAYFKTHISGLDYTPAPFIMQLTQQGDTQQVLRITQSGVPVMLQKGFHTLKIHLCVEWQLDFSVSFYGQNQINMKRVKTYNKWSGRCCKQ